MTSTVVDRDYAILCDRMGLFTLVNQLCAIYYKLLLICKEQCSFEAAQMSVAVCQQQTVLCLEHEISG